MKNNIAFVTVLMLLMLSGCETIKSYFPDKEKDYRYISEIPPLVVPSDLKEQTLADRFKQLTNKQAAAEETGSALEQAPEPEYAGAPDQSVSAQESLHQESIDQELVEPGIEKSILDKNYAAGIDDSDKAKVTEVVLVNGEGKAPYLRVNQNLARTWRIVGKALTRQAFEITERNTEEHYYAVQYDPDAQPSTDGSLWDDVVFLFGSEKNLEREYRIHLIENDPDTVIALSTKDNQSCEDEKCAKLLAAIQNAMQEALKN